MAGVNVGEDRLVFVELGFCKGSNGLMQNMLRILKQYLEWHFTGNMVNTGHQQPAHNIQLNKLNNILMQLQQKLKQQSLVLYVICLHNL